MSAAKQLQDAGMNVVVLEAKDCVGGRARSSNALGGSGEVHLGGSWLHGSEGHFLNCEPFRVGSEAWEWTLDTAVVSDDGQSASFIDTSRIEVAYDVVERAIQSCAAAATEMQCLAEVFQECLQKSELQGLEAHVLECILTADFEQSYACKINTLSLRYCREPYHLPSSAGSGVADFHSDYIITSPLSKAILKLSGGLDVRTSVRVREVLCSSDSVAITTDIETFTADFVVITASLGVLKADTIKFEPPLPKDVVGR
jgi:monoamine oxidase